MSNDKSVEKWKQKAATPTPRVKPHNVFFNPGSEDESQMGEEESTTIPQTHDHSVVQNKTKNNSETRVKQIQTTQKAKTINEQIQSTNVTDTEDVHIISVQTQQDKEHVSPIEAFLEITKQRETVEDTHTRKTFIIKNELLKRFEKLQKKHGRGFQTWFINEAIGRLLTEIEGNKK